VAKKKTESEETVKNDAVIVNVSATPVPVDGSELAPETPPVNLTVVSETQESEASSAAVPEPGDLNALLDDKFPKPDGDETLDEKIDAFLEERALKVETETSDESAEMPVPADVRVLAKGTIIAASGGDITLAHDTFIKWIDSEQALVGTLLSWNPQNIARNAEKLRLKYNGNAQLLPLAQQCRPSELAEFIPSLSVEEAVGMGLNRAAYQKYTAAKAARDAAVETTEESAETEATA
jgi:hypothetical protein